MAKDKGQKTRPSIEELKERDRKHGQRCSNGHDPKPKETGPHTLDERRNHGKMALVTKTANNPPPLRMR